MSVSPGLSDVVLEPGPGHGTLTRLLLEKAGKVVAIEKDPDLAQELRTELSRYPNARIIQGDVLKMWESLPSFNKLVSTPPYYISSKLTLLLASKKFDLASIVFQKEFGERLRARPGTRDYGRLSVAAQRKLDVEQLLEISRTAFSPRPKVDSVLLRFRPKQTHSELDEVLFDEMVRGIFTQRRRLLKGALRHFLTLKYGKNNARMLMSNMSPPEARVYELTIDQLENLSLQLWRTVSSLISSDSLSK